MRSVLVWIVLATALLGISGISQHAYSVSVGPTKSGAFACTDCFRGHPFSFIVGGTQNAATSGSDTDKPASGVSSSGAQAGTNSCPGGKPHAQVDGTAGVCAP